jgi:hypothetical protein
VELIKMVELENHDSLIQPAACGQGIVGLNLIELEIFGNNKITDVSFMTNLKILITNRINGVITNKTTKIKILGISFIRNLEILLGNNRWD